MKIASTKRQGYLSAFHSGDIEKKGMFPFSTNQWLHFNSEKEVNDFINKMKTKVKESKERLGKDRVKELCLFINTFKATN